MSKTPRFLKFNKKTAHFFISINKQGPHSFLMLGLYDQNKVQHVLCRVGKFGDGIENPNFLFSLRFVCNSLFFANDAHLEDEGISRSCKDARSITYQAYDITYEQYLEFVRILESLQSSNNKFKCYKPCKSPSITNSDAVTLEFTDEKRLLLPINTELLKTHLSKLNISNTCRHSAIELVEAIQHTHISSSVSSSFFVNLPYETVLQYGRPSEDIPFYVLPPPPTAFHESDKAKEKIIIKLYSRMENMLFLEPNSQYTQDKFLKLKELYLNIVGPQNNLSLDELLRNIHTWKEDKDNQKVLNVLRKEYFWDSLPFIKRQSATMSLLAEVEDDLATEITNRLS
ncbi:hypothetical protein [Legionella tucsonensis]|uniref:Uncharacterized protein n=1 Tax=Legionella tucsonensis TaxID=40335 RepID=A0A0W0ZVZ2_9GAMM|nr:hypothetical protein [Legionella tucsonensis]KTD72992.1 hypothetical protein Ltuc_0839 [Legionella tucsonensis]